MADTLERVSITIEKDLLDRFDALVERAGHGNRSEAIRDLIRDRLIEEEWSRGKGEAVATVTLVYNHNERRVGDRLIEAGHAHHHEIIATTHIHLDHDHCLEIVAMKGKRENLRRIADELIGLRGVLHGKLSLSDAA
jgi:CopG family nickel-responsive transcriptional regulator